MVAFESTGEQWWQRVWRLLWRAPRRGQWFSRWFIKALAGLVLVPSLALWYEPFLLPYAAGVLVWLMGIAVWWQWLGTRHFGAWLAGATTLTLFWASSFVFWLFLENPSYRVLWLVLLALCSWWYLTEWHRLRQRLFVGEPLVASAPNLTLGFLIAFTLGVSAESFLVYLDASVFSLFLVFYLPLVASFIALAKLSGWSPLQAPVYPITAAVLLAQVFALVTWWPTSFYVAGFTLAVTYLVVALVVRQESQGFLNRRSFWRELGVLLGSLALVLLSARWV